MTDMPHHKCECNDCGTKTTYHVFDHESQGDVVKAYCPNCEEDKPHTIREFVA